MPEVSVIIPNYNHAPYLKQRIDSVLNQTYQDFEVIILDDKSSDDSVTVINQYANHPKIANIIFNTVNSGSPFKQWQKGVELAQGKYIWIAESDDYADKSLLSVLMHPFEKHTDVVLSFCQSFIISTDTNKPKLMDWADALNASKWKSDYVESANVELKSYLLFRNTIPNASAVVFLKPTLDLFDEIVNYKMVGDWLFWRKILSISGKIAFSAKPLNYFRIHPQTTRVASTKEKEERRFKELRKLMLPSINNIFHKRYDWMLEEWYANRQVLKGTRYFYIPDLPLTTQLRLPLMLLQKFKHFLSELQ